ncbi:hypothetical protein L484_004809 [Morus notabilis]|uniref:DUF7787 domain-containing protein n=1 Tax=Morus notabilis TaxID=981085 RepID=W9R9X9_9ROSA|nr:uncharacterized protein LOC21388299 [Morus notabilis]EXB78107.1 hypothetical protein L484_004809 [Morus notabilis]
MAMQIFQREEHCKRISKWKARNAKISLEAYRNLIDSRNFSDLSINYLNQIISMHGYKKIHKAPKKVITEAVSSISFANPSRSTLRDEISPSVSATVEAVVSDLNALNWQECSVTSVQSLNSTIHLATKENSNGDKLKGPPSKWAAKRKKRD